MRAKVLLDLVAKKLFLTKGMGVHEDKLTSFEYALRNAGIAGTNLVLTFVKDDEICKAGLGHISNQYSRLVQSSYLAPLA